MRSKESSLINKEGLNNISYVNNKKMPLFLSLVSDILPLK